MNCNEINALFHYWRKEEAEPFSGWDFSHIADRCIMEPPPWSYEDMARRLMSKSSAVLDLGTGGGERLSAMRDVFPERVVATEEYLPSLMLARERLSPYGVEVVETEPSSLKQKLPFGDGKFDLVIDRHTCFNISEVERILTPNGIFLTEQVDGRNHEDLCQIFDCEPQWPFFTLGFVLDSIRSTGLVVEIAQEWEGRTMFKDIGAIVYYLKAVPWTVPNFSVETHYEYLLKLQDRIKQEGKIEFARRLLLIRARKA